MDGLLFNQAIKWILAELVRLVGNVPLQEAQAIVERLSTRWSPAVWETDKYKRILIDGLTVSEKALCLIYFSDLSTNIENLRAWLGITNITNFKSRSLVPLDERNLINFDAKTGDCNLLPAGIRMVEEKLLSRAVPASA